MSSDEAMIEARLRERMRLDDIEKTSRQALDATRAFDDRLEAKTERLSHNLIGQITDQWDAKIEALEARLEKMLERQITALDGRLVSKKDLPGMVEDGVVATLGKQRNVARGQAKFWLGAIVNTISIVAGVGTGIFWILQTISHQGG